MSPPNSERYLLRRRRLETLLELLDPTDPVLDQMADLAERRLVELAHRSAESEDWRRTA